MTVVTFKPKAKLDEEARYQEDMSEVMLVTQDLNILLEGTRHDIAILALVTLLALGIADTMGPEVSPEEEATKMQGVSKILADKVRRHRAEAASMERPS